LFFNVCQNWSAKLSNCLNRIKLDIKSIESEVEYVKTIDFEQHEDRIFNESIESFSKFVSAGDLLIDEKLSEITDDILKLDGKWTTILVEHFVWVHSSFVSKELLQLSQLLFALDLVYF